MGLGGSASFALRRHAVGFTLVPHVARHTLRRMSASYTLSNAGSPVDPLLYEGDEAVVEGLDPVEQ